MTVTELLMCQRMEKEEPIEPEQVENIVKTAITCAEDKPTRAFMSKSKWPICYLCSLLLGSAALWFIYSHGLGSDTVYTAMLLGAGFGAYFCFFVRLKLPTFYDQNRSGLYADGPIRMNIPGVVFTNSNWPHIVRTARLWCCLTMALYPALHLAMGYFLPELWSMIHLYVFLTLTLGGLFVPIYIVAKKYE